MALFNKILCKLLYPQNTFDEVKNIYVINPDPSVKLFTNTMQYKTHIVKNTKYKDFLFFLSNCFLFFSDGNNIASNDTEPNIQFIYTTVSKKYRFLKKNINTFMTSTIDDFINLFRDVQKHYYAFARFANIWKYKRSSVQIDYDLYMTPLDRNNRNVFTLLQHGKVYLFTSANLVNSICTSLSNCPDFFVEPLIIKNPYNNIPLNKSDLYNIYFFLKQSPIIMPILFHNYFLTDFDLHKFSMENENIIKNMAFQSYIRNASVAGLYSSTIRMLKKYQKNIVIHKDFPKEVLVNIMRPYLLLYYISEYSSEEYRIINAELLLKYKLKKLYKHNVAFGRKLVKLKRVGFSARRQKYIEFSDNHPNFDDPIDMEVYQKTHIELIDEDYEQNENNSITNVENHNEDEDEDNNNSSVVIVSSHPSLYISNYILTAINLSSQPTNVTIMENDLSSESESDSDENTRDQDTDTQSDEIVIDNSSDSDSENEDDE